MGAFATLNQYGDWGLLALRIAVGVIFLVHGLQKWAMWKMQPSEQLPVGMLSLLKFLSIAEPLGAVAVLSGFLTQMAAAGLGVIMVGAIWLKARVMKEPFTDSKAHKVGWEFDFILLAATIALFFFGGGTLALDRVFFAI